MSDLNSMLRTIYSKLEDRDDDIDPVTVYAVYADQGELVAACLDRMSFPEYRVFLNKLHESMWMDSTVNIVAGGVIEHFDIGLISCQHIIQCGMNKYSYTDYLNELAEEKNCEDSESDNERNEYENSTLKTI